jgi:uncharacterized protein YjbI with pentapeptide repeats
LCWTNECFLRFSSGLSIMLSMGKRNVSLNGADLSGAKFTEADFEVPTFNPLTLRKLSGRKS